MARGGTPLAFGAPSLEASNQAQIEDLVQRNRTLDHTNKKLVEQIALEKVKATDAIAEIRRQGKAEQIDLLHGSDLLQSCHRIFQFRNVMELERERSKMLKAQQVAHTEKFLRLEREIEITMLKSKEADLVDRIQELEKERDDIITDFEAGQRQHDQQIDEYVAQQYAKDEELSISEKDKESLQDSLAQLRETHARLQADYDKLSSKLERITLQRDGAVTARDELKTANEEMTRAKAEMLRQIEKWQSLETKGGAEIEAERKKRVELDIQVRELQSELESAKEHHEKLLRKETRRVEKLKEANEALQAAAEKHEEESEAANSRLAKAERKIAKLRAALEARAESPLPSQTADEDAVVPQPSPPREPSPKPKPRSRRAPNAEAGPSGTNNEDKEQPAKKRKRKAAESDVEEIPKPKPKPKTAPVHDNDDEELSRKPKSNAKGKGKAKTVEESDEQVEIVAPSQEPQKARRKTKRNGADLGDEATVNNDVELVDTGPTATKTPSNDKAAATTKVQRKTMSRIGSASTAHQRDEETADAEEPTKKKRRKIMAFPSTEPFTFEAIGGGTSGLNIPTSLSPVKESDNVPSRSTSGSVFGNLSSMLRSSFSARR